MHLQLPESIMPNIIFLYVIELMEGEKLKRGIKLTDKAEELMQQAQNFAEESGIPSKSIIKISHRISKGIYDTAIGRGM